MFHLPLWLPQSMNPQVDRCNHKFRFHRKPSHHRHHSNTHPHNPNTTSQDTCSWRLPMSLCYRSYKPHRRYSRRTSQTRIEPCPSSQHRHRSCMIPQSYIQLPNSYHLLLLLHCCNLGCPNRCNPRFPIHHRFRRCPHRSSKRHCNRKIELRIRTSHCQRYCRLHSCKQMHPYNPHKNRNRNHSQSNNPMRHRSYMQRKSNNLHIHKSHRLQ